MRQPVGVIFALFALWAVGLACSESEGNAPMHVEEFQVAEPLRTGAEASLQDQLETITAVTKPYDEVEAAVDEEPERLARTKSELHIQCLTVLKEMAFCTTEDSYLDIIGTAPKLRADEERQRFLSHVESWFEPGGTDAACSQLLMDDEFRQRPAMIMWQRSSEATVNTCDDFGEELLEAATFQWLGRLWE